MIRTHLRALALAIVLVIASSVAASAGCPPVDLKRCEVLHDHNATCASVKRLIPVRI